MPDRHPLVDAAQQLDQLIRSSADAVEHNGTLTLEVVSALRRAGLFHVLVPAPVGGAGADLLTAIEVIEIVSRADGSTGWSLMANGTATSLIAAYAPDRAIDRIFGSSDGAAICGGMLGPGGRLVLAEGGYRGSGRYRFGSGIAHCDWIGAGFLVTTDVGTLRTLESGRVEVRVAVLPSDRVELTGNWDVAGLNGTGSFDYVVAEQTIDDDMTFEVSSTSPLRGGRQFEIAVWGLSSLGHAAVALGITARALEEIAHLSGDKSRLGYGGPIGDHALFLHEFTHHEAIYRSARAYLYAVFDDAQRVLSGPGQLSDELRARFRQVLTYVHRVAAEVVAWCYRWAGTTALRNPHPLGRCLRDINAATQHLFVDPITYVDAAPPLLDAWRRHEYD